MFTIRAKYSDTVEIRAAADRVRDYFSNIKNFVEMMPEIESIHTDHKGVTHWKIHVEVPFIGTFSQTFPVRLAEQSDERTEWIPVEGETQNFLRYSADILDEQPEFTRLGVTQMVEMRRRSATELHLLAGVAGEALISGEMNRRIASMLENFIKKSKEKLEKGL